MATNFSFPSPKLEIGPGHAGRLYTILNKQLGICIIIGMNGKNGDDRLVHLGNNIFYLGTPDKMALCTTPEYQTKLDVLLQWPNLILM